MRKAIFGLSNIREQIESLKGQGVDLEVNIGRKKIRQFSGTIQSVYPSVFTFIDNSGILKTYSYSDILCGDVKILGEEQAQ